jgi:hypothetical protein
MVLRNQLAPERQLIVRVFIIDIEDLRFGPDILFGLAVAIHTPVHVKVIDLIR